MNIVILILICLAIAFLAIMLILCYAESHDKSLKSEQKVCDKTIKRIKHENKN